MLSKFKLTSFENASILRRLTILYFIISIVPVMVLYYLYIQLKDYGRIEITEENLNTTLFIVVLGVGIGYVALRSLLVKVIDITKENREALKNLLGPDKIRAISAGSSNEVSILSQSFNEITSRLEENIRNLELAKKTLHAVLSKVGEGISTMENIDNFLNLIIETVTEAFHAEMGVLLLFDEKRNDLYVKTVYGNELDHSKQVRISRNNPIFRSVLDSKQPAIIKKVQGESSAMALFHAPLVCAPLVLHDDVLGMITVGGRKSEEEFEAEEMTLLYNLALQTAVAIENSKLNSDAEKTYFETISALAMAVEAKDPYSRGHSDRVSKLVVQMAQALNLSQEEIDALRDAAKLHDLGKIGITDKVLMKAGPLNVQEMGMMKKHCEIGEGIIKPIRSLKNLCDIVLHHHEKLDGSGYPHGLKGDQIHILVRILAVADIFDALTSNRKYRKAFPPEKAIEELREMKEQVDQKIVDTLVKIL